MTNTPTEAAANESIEQQAHQKAVVLKEKRATLDTALETLDQIGQQIEESEAHIQAMEGKARDSRAKRQDLVREAHSARTREVRSVAVEEREKRLLIRDHHEQITWLKPELKHAQVEVAEARQAFETARDEYRTVGRISAFDTAWRAVMDTPEGQALAAVWIARRDQIRSDVTAAPVFKALHSTAIEEGQRVAKDNTERDAGRMLLQLFDTAATESEVSDPAQIPDMDAPKPHSRELPLREARSNIARRRLREQAEAERAKLIA